MVWYFNNELAFQYPSGQKIDNALVRKFKDSVYSDSDEMELYYSLWYMKRYNIPALTVIFPIEELSVNYGNEEDINKEFCDINSIKYRYENRSGGCMVLFPGNIIIQDVYPTDNFLRQHGFLNAFVEYLQNKGIDAITNNNDLMVDGNKVVGAVSETLPEPYKGSVFFGLSISISSDPELISKICTKNSVKVPGALSDYGVTTEEVMKFALEWFDKHRYEDEIR